MACCHFLSAAFLVCLTISLCLYICRCLTSGSGVACCRTCLQVPATVWQPFRTSLTRAVKHGRCWKCRTLPCSSWVTAGQQPAPETAICVHRCKAYACLLSLSRLHHADIVGLYKDAIWNRSWKTTARRGFQVSTRETRAYSCDIARVDLCCRLDKDLNI